MSWLLQLLFPRMLPFPNILLQKILLPKTLLPKTPPAKTALREGGAALVSLALVFGVLVVVVMGSLVVMSRTQGQLPALRTDVSSRFVRVPMETLKVVGLDHQLLNPTIAANQTEIDAQLLRIYNILSSSGHILGMPNQANQHLSLCVTLVRFEVRFDLGSATITRFANLVNRSNGTPGTTPAVPNMVFHVNCTAAQLDSLLLDVTPVNLALKSGVTYHAPAGFFDGNRLVASGLYSSGLSGYRPPVAAPSSTTTPAP